MKLRSLVNAVLFSKLGENKATEYLYGESVKEATALNIFVCT